MLNECCPLSAASKGKIPKDPEIFIKEYLKQSDKDFEKNF